MYCSHDMMSMMCLVVHVHMCVCGVCMCTWYIYAPVICVWFYHYNSIGCIFLVVDSKCFDLMVKHNLVMNNHDAI